MNQNLRLAELLLVGPDHASDTAGPLSHAAAVRSWLDGQEVPEIAVEVLDAFRAFATMFDTAPQLKGIGAEQMWASFVEDRRDDLMLVLNVEALLDAGAKLTGGG